MVKDPWKDMFEKGKNVKSPGEAFWFGFKYTTIHFPAFLVSGIRELREERKREKQEENKPFVQRREIVVKETSPIYKECVKHGLITEGDKLTIETEWEERV